MRLIGCQIFSVWCPLSLAAQVKRTHYLKDVSRKAGFFFVVFHEVKLHVMKKHKRIFSFTRKFLSVIER